MKYGVVDVGSSGVKLSIYDEELRLLHTERTAISSAQPGGLSEYNAKELAQIVLHYLRRLGELGVRLAGMATFRASVLAWSRDGEPLTPLISWLDERGKAFLNRFPYSALRHLPLLSKVLRPDSPAVKIAWLLQSRPSLAERVRKGEAYVGTLSSYLAYLLSKRYVNDVTNETLTALVHPKTLRKLEIVYRLLHIPLEVGAEVVDNASYIGSYGGIEVSSLIADQQASILGSSCVRLDCIKLTAGTGTFVDAVVEDFMVPPGRLIPLVAFSVKGNSVYAVEGYTAGAAVVDWMARVSIVESVELLEGAASRAERSVVFIPSLSPIPLPARREGGTGLLYGLSLSHGREDIARGVLEGLVLSAAEVIGIVEEAAGKRLYVRADGGLSKSTLYLKLLASASGRRLERVRSSYAAGRGVAALLAIYSGAMKLQDIERSDVDFTAEPGEERIKVDVKVWREHLKWGWRSSLGK
ncbi:MAG: FGGY family carbohydrate kinase [Acidilobaceae archaeon]|nr:FGGY family carbohydrate kinase [Acidilobaceae archaeon]MCX8166022.1 FGGY family carbohydrate kinase [Acidilobaceae archaeon]MDW7974663.1 FGGY family carbohydrate kinase [Sulfolobales archaeon]